MDVLLNADYSSIRGQNQFMVTNVLFQQTLLNALRRDTGYVFTIQFVPFSSNIFRRFGYYQLQWVVGVSNQTLSAQVDQSLALLQTVLRSGFDEHSFRRSKAALVSELRSQLQESAAWLPVMRGLALYPPVWHRPSPSVSSPFTIKDLAQTDILSQIQRMTLADVNAFFRDHVVVGSPIPVSVIEITSLSKPTGVLGAPACDWRLK
jgi:hypothetical protein